MDASLATSAARPTVEEDVMGLFHGAIKSPETRKKYDWGLATFCAFVGLTPQEFVKRARQDPGWAQERILTYVLKRKAEGAKGGALRVAVSPIKLLLEQADITGLNWRRITRLYPADGPAQDRAPTVEEVRAVAGDTDHRVKVGVLCMATGGLRVGAFDGLLVKHVQKTEGEGVTLGAIKVYAGAKEEYQTYIGPEPWTALETYLAHRRANGEQVGPDSPVIRHRYKEGEAGRGKVVPLAARSLEHLIARRLRAVGLRSGIKKKRGERYDTAVCHAYRKFFKTQCEQVMKPLNVEVLMGHNTGLAGRYYRPRDVQLLQDYLKALPTLAILSPPPAVESADLAALRAEVDAMKAERAQAAPRGDFVGTLLGELAAEADRSPEFRRVLEAIARRAGAVPR